jgi:tetratricopeptide (TPR) repeat protein
VNDPDAARAHRAAGWNLYRVRRYADAAREAQLALASGPDDGEAHGLQALALSMLGRHSDATKAVGAALAADPQSEWTHRIRAQVLLNAGQPRPALASAKEAIRLQPNAPEGHSLAAEIQLRLGENAAAYGSARSALSLHPRHVASLVRAAHAAERLGKTEPALDYARRAVSADPQDADTHRALGVAAFRAGDRATARDALREALRLDPMNEAARMELLRTLRARSPVYRATFAVTRWFQGPGAKATRGVAVGVCIAARGMADAAGQHGFSKVFLLLPVMLVLPLWIIPLHDLIVWRDPFGRWLLQKWEKIGAAFTGATLVVALVLVVGFSASRDVVWAWAAAGFAAFGAYGSLVRLVRTRGGAWRIGVVAALLLAELVGGWIDYELGGRGDASLLAALFPLTLLIALLGRKRLIGKPPARRG